MKMGDIIKSLRIQKGMTQEELGKVIGVQKSAIRKYESGMVENIKRTSIKKMAQLFGVSPTYLMGMEENVNYGVNNGIIGNNNQNNHIHNEKKLAPITEAILTICENLNESQQGQVLTYATSLLSKKEDK
ncbi:MAG: helix-turn-helix transcriptional regulator [Clostridia bacterium]|nr:helix-turn-helix transcriptional regulator [Clostridia bacterium]